MHFKLILEALTILLHLCVLNSFSSLKTHYIANKFSSFSLCFLGSNCNSRNEFSHQPHHLY